MEVLKKLLTSFYISKEFDKENYYTIKDNLKAFQSFLRDKLGYNIMVRGEFIKIEKLPGRAESFMGIDEFTEEREYVFLMLILMFLEDKGRDEQFLLSHILDFISSNKVNNEIDWTIYYIRRSLIKVIRFLINNKVMVINDGDEESFVKDSSKEILFESTGISKYMVRSFKFPVDENTTLAQINEDVNIGLEEDKGVIRRNRVYRDLLLSPICYKEDDRVEDYEYIRNYRTIIDSDFNKYLGLKLQVHKNGAMLVLGEEKFNGIEVFPNTKGISDFVLHILKYLNQGIRNEINGLSNTDLYSISKVEFEKIIEIVKMEKGEGLSKEFREGTFSKITYEVISYMERMKFIKEKGEEIIIYPLAGKLLGDYPKDFINEQLEDKKSE